MGGEVRCQFTVKPVTAGERTLSVMFDSKELEDVDGMLTVTVTEATPAACETGTGEFLTLPRGSVDIVECFP